ncbi:MAG: hypothetical protein H3C47_08990 [Candidatus Cloacimonetes bacterium]|nr:hypothetical protein [Candidatus Cloacimonadota bacterium]
MKRIKVTICMLLLATMSPRLSADVSIEAQTMFKNALELNSQGDYPNALSQYIQAYNSDPDILGLGDEGLMDNATRYFTEYLNNNSGDITALMWLASIYTMKGDLRLAMDYYQKVILYAPNSDSAIQADKEILRMEEILKSRQSQEEQKVQDKMAMSQIEERIRSNVVRDMETKYRAQITSLQEEVDRLKKQLYSSEQEKDELLKSKDEIAAGVDQLEAENERNRKMYLYYRRKAIDSEK